MIQVLAVWYVRTWHSKSDRRPEAGKAGRPDQAGRKLEAHSLCRGFWQDREKVDPA